MSFDLTVNGERRTVDVEAGTPLLWVLRDTLGLAGTKYGCGEGLCGSCTVHLDGRAVSSCQVAVEDVGTRAVTTIEGLEVTASHPLGKAWIEHSVIQCGYCQAGQIMTAAALLAGTDARPSDDEVDTAMSRVLCRCGTYQRIRSAIAQAAEEMR